MEASSLIAYSSQGRFTRERARQRYFVFGNYYNRPLIVNSHGNPSLSSCAQTYSPYTKTTIARNFRPHSSCAPTRPQAQSETCLWPVLSRTKLSYRGTKRERGTSMGRADTAGGKNGPRRRGKYNFHEPNRRQIARFPFLRQKRTAILQWLRTGNASFTKETAKPPNHESGNNA